MTEAKELPRFSAEMFASPPKDCDIVMKGGITSGLVYPYAILELARCYRFRSIGGTSAGAIAAALAAAAEYSRTVREDPAGFTRLQERCDMVPEILGQLFQPEPKFRPLMAYLLRAQAGGWLARIIGLPLAFPLASLIGLLLGAWLLWAVAGDIAAIVLGALVGLGCGIAVRLVRIVLRDLPQRGFGLCSGRTERGYDAPGLTDWLHESIQYVAYGDDGAETKPLTFGDLTGADPAKPVINLRMVTTNLSMRRPHTLPTLNLDLAYDAGEWGPLFPGAVTRVLAEDAERDDRFPELNAFPKPERLPVIVAARMSLSFPILFKAIPTYVDDRGTQEILHLNTTAVPKDMKARVWLADGGISSNFPIHLFDALLPSRPTFALSLDELPPGADEAGERVAIPQNARQGIGIPVRPIWGIGAYAGSILGSAKDWQDQMLAAMPGQRERIARVFLSAAEGGLNLKMPPDRSAALMGYGREVGERFATGALDFDEHRWRRALVAYDQLEDTILRTGEIWDGGFNDWLAEFMTQAQSYGSVTDPERQKVHAGLAAFAELTRTFSPPISNKRRKFPRPVGRLRIGPNV